MTSTNAWLVAQGRVLASATVADTRAQRRRGMLGQKHPEFALVLPNCRWVHTIGMRCALDVAYLDDESRVMKVQQLSPMRLPMPVLAAHSVVEARAGSFERWGVRVGDVVEVRRVNDAPSTSRPV
ncbi:MAG: hypothetical protein RLZZ538_372 [Actinomycetota bacterium]|jgi:uncharacterized membrane protein (UPF0127 family)